MSQMYKVRKKPCETAGKSSDPSSFQSNLSPNIRPAHYPWAEESEAVQSTLDTVTSLDPHAGKQLHLDEAISNRMQDKFGIRMDQVELRESDQAAQMDAKAFAKGNVIQFAPGQFQPDTQQGQQLLQHELSHVAQQARGGIHADVPGLNINANEGLEHQADLGASAGSGGAPMSVGSLDAASAPVQGDFGAKIKDFFQKLSRSCKWAFYSAGTGIKEFVGGKMGLLKPSEEEQAANLEKAMGGDYSRLARAKRDDVQTQLVDPRKQQISADLANLSDDEMRGRYAGSTTQMLDPINRKAMSQLARDESLPEEERKRLRDLTEGMDTQMMINTMSTPTDEQREALVRHYENIEDQRRLVREYELSNSGKTYLGSEGDGTPDGALQARDTAYNMVNNNWLRSRPDAETLADADIQRSQNASDAMLRMMFLMQIGNFQRTDKDAEGNKTNREWDQTMANAFSHGGRTGFVFDKTTTDANGKAVSTDDVADAIFGANMGHDAGVHTRAAGTHYIKTGGGRADYTEKGGIWAAIKSKMSSRYQHYGMDMAIGGIGREGVAGEGGQGALINADGRSGHMYIGKKTSTADKAGGLLVGLESDSPYRMNQTGHMHNAAAESEEGSSTGGLKTDLQGKKYGGRTVDLGGLKNEEVVGLLNGFTQHFSSLRSGDAAQQAQYQALLGQIAGKRMDADSLRGLMGNFVQDEDELERLMGIFRH